MRLTKAKLLGPRWGASKRRGGIAGKPGHRGGLRGSETAPPLPEEPVAGADVTRVECRRRNASERSSGLNCAPVWTIASIHTLTMASVTTTGRGNDYSNLSLVPPPTREL